jgi:transaldolase
MPAGSVRWPVTPAGIAAPAQVIDATLNVNMTLIFSASQIQAVRPPTAGVWHAACWTGYRYSAWPASPVSSSAPSTLR